jgi:hypothetical protein
MRLPSGCAFGERCAHSFDACATRQPQLLDRLGTGHLDACHLNEQQKHALRDRTVHPELVEEKP